MAGYMTKLQGYVYDGELTAADNLVNGQFVTVNENEKVEAIDTPQDMVVSVVSLENVQGRKGMRCTVKEAGDDLVYLVENIPEGELVYDESAYGPKAGEFVRKHRLLAGEEFVISEDIVSPTGFVPGEWFYVGEDAKIPAEMTVTKTITKVVDTSESSDITGEDLDSFVLAEGDVIHYSVTVKNTGDLALTDISLDCPEDSNSPTTIATLAKGATSNAVTYTYTVAAEEAGTSVTNTATATAAHPRFAGKTITAGAEVSVGFVADTEE